MGCGRCHPRPSVTSLWPDFSQLSCDGQLWVHSQHPIPKAPRKPEVLPASGFSEARLETQPQASKMQSLTNRARGLVGGCPTFLSFGGTTPRGILRGSSDAPGGCAPAVHSVTSSMATVRSLLPSLPHLPRVTSPTSHRQKGAQPLLSEPLPRAAMQGTAPFIMLYQE